MQASKVLFEGLTAKLSGHLASHDSLAQGSPRSKHPDGKTRASDGHLAEICLALDRLDIKGRLVVQPGG